jgi:hypothetical protein
MRFFAMPNLRYIHFWLEANHSNHGIERVHGIDTRTAFGLIVETGYPKPCTNV